MSAVESVIKRSPAELIKRLREEAERNPAFNAVAHVFAMRERARDRVSLPTLRHTMYREGYHYTKVEFEGILRFLSNLGIGRLETAKDGNPIALVNITSTLQSIGLAALGKEPNVQRLAAPKQYKPLAATIPNKPVADKAPVKPVLNLPKFPISITTTIDNKQVSFATPLQLTLGELNDLLNDMNK